MQLAKVILMPLQTRQYRVSGISLEVCATGTSVILTSCFEQPQLLGDRATRIYVGRMGQRGETRELEER